MTAIRPVIQCVVLLHSGPYQRDSRSLVHLPPHPTTMLRALSRPLLLILASVVLMGGLTGCEALQTPIQTTTSAQQAIIDANLLESRPSPANATGAVFGDAIELIGWEMSPAQPAPGEQFTLTLYWEAKRDITQRWEIFVHYDSQVTNLRQNLDHHAIDGAYPTPLWRRGDIIRDSVTRVFEPRMLPGEITMWIGLYRQSTRMPVTAPGTGQVDSEGRLFIGAYDI